MSETETAGMVALELSLLRGVVQLAHRLADNPEAFALVYADMMADARRNPAAAAYMAAMGGEPGAETARRRAHSMTMLLAEQLGMRAHGDGPEPGGGPGLAMPPDMTI